MSAYEADPRVSDFTTCLSRRARQCLQGTVSLADLIRALDAGWTPAEMARACSNDLPNDNTAYALVQRRIRWYAEHQPGSTKSPAAGPAPWCGRCDDTTFRYEVDADGLPVRPCPRCHPSTVGVAT